MILKEGKVLLGKRHPDPQKADSELHGEGTWTMPGGKLDFGEELKEAAGREVFEETGIRLDGARLKMISVTGDVAKDAHFITIGFLYKDPEQEPGVMEPDEIIEWRWFDLNDLPDPIFPPSKKLLDNFLKKSLPID